MGGRTFDPRPTVPVWCFTLTGYPLTPYPHYPHVPYPHALVRLMDRDGFRALVRVMA